MSWAQLYLFRERKRDIVVSSYMFYPSGNLDFMVLAPTEYGRPLKSGVQRAVGSED